MKKNGEKHSKWIKKSKSHIDIIIKENEGKKKKIIYRKRLLLKKKKWKKDEKI